MEYALIESHDDLNSGGGPLSLQWTADWLQRGWARISSDATVRAPNGDGDLHPLSAKAPSIQGRARIGAALAEHVTIAFGFFSQRVSPPSDSELPDEYFPSGSGVDFLGDAQLGRLGMRLEARHATAGLERANWLRLRASWALDEQLDVSIGAVVSPGPRQDRLLESGWQLALSWRPAAASAPQPPAAPALEATAPPSLSSKSVRMDPP